MKTILLFVCLLWISACVQASPPNPSVQTSASAPTSSPQAANRPAATTPQTKSKNAGMMAATPATQSSGNDTRATEGSTSVVEGSFAARSEVQAFIEAMTAQHGFDRDELYRLFSRIQSQSDIIGLMTRPAETKPWHAYRDIFLTQKRIQGGVEFWNTHQAALSRAEQRYGVPPEVIVAIIGVETAYGQNTGSHSVLQALATLAFDYPRRADFFRKELEHYLLLTREEAIDPLTLQGSYAGAMGLGQFMPSSYRAYGLDFDGDQRRDLWSNPEDAIGSVANYLKEHRWRPGEPITSPVEVEGDRYQALVSQSLDKPTRSVASFRQRGVEPIEPVDASLEAMLLQLQGSRGPEYWLGFDNFYVITRYNRSPLYAMAVYQLSQDIRRRKS